MAKKKQIKENFKLFCPESSADIREIIATLLENETSILVNLSKYNLKKDAVSLIMDYISNCQTSYMMIMVKKVHPKAFICWSKHPEFYF